MEEILIRPAAGQVDADTASCLADARPDLEQLHAQGLDLCGAHRRRQLQAKQVDQVIGETVEQQAKCIGPKAVAAQAVSGETIFELFNAVLTFSAIVIKGKNGRAAAWQVGDQKTQVGASRGVFGFVADASLMRPGVSAIAKAGKGVLRLASSTISFRETMLEPLRFTLQPGVGAYANGILDAEKLAEFIEQRHGETSVCA